MVWPRGLHRTPHTVKIDVREGGAQKFVMVSEENLEFTSPVNGTFHKLVPGELIEGYEAIGAELAETHGMEAGSYFLNRVLAA